MRVGRLDAIGELLGVGNAGDLGFHPNEIGTRSVSSGALDAVVNTGLELVVSFADSAKFPVEVDRVLLANDLVGGPTSLGVAQSVRIAGLPFGNHVTFGPLTDGKRLDLGKDGLAECHQVGFRSPCLGITCIEERSNTRSGNPEDERVVSTINVGIEESSGLGIRTCHDDGAGAHDVRRQTSSDEPITMFLRRYQNFAAHMATLLSSGLLVFEVNAGSTCLDEELGELHDGRESTMTSIAIGNYRGEVIHLVAGFPTVQ
mmetsp:Transcript_28300/g.81856  ORF Transcript_28300/g.81856 Transcript_28300/m.81856 type:complete len:259 (-) Transcript_28300:741-1517(-)